MTLRPYLRPPVGPQILIPPPMRCRTISAKLTAAWIAPRTLKGRVWVTVGPADSRSALPSPSPQKMDEVYQLQLPATSIFGEAKDNKMPMQAYAKFLAANNALAIAVVTEMYFDENSEVPKLFFKPVRPLTEEELEKAVEMREHQDTKRAVTMTVAQTDGVQKVEVKEAPQARRKAPRQRHRGRGARA